MSAIDPTLFESLRTALMDRYSSQTTAHVGYVIALIVFFASIISQWKDVRAFYGKKLSRKCLVCILVASMSILLIYLILRILYWSALSDGVIVVRSEQINLNNTTIIQAIQDTTIAQFKTISAFPQFINYLAYQSYAMDLYSESIILLLFNFVVLAIYFRNGLINYLKTALRKA